MNKLLVSWSYEAGAAWVADTPEMRSTILDAIIWYNKIQARQIEVWEHLEDVPQSTREGWESPPDDYSSWTPEEVKDGILGTGYYPR